MKNYDFNILSPYEFELLTRDLLQLHFDIYLESFGEGADQGIDLRYSKGGLLIIQAKRYKTFSNLFTNLTKEVEKVKKLNPEKYILATSVSLSPANKLKIKKLFDPFIQFDEEILGREDFNNLLNKFHAVERNFFKLWLSSTDILNEIYNNQIINQSNFSREEIFEKLEIYVQNESFNEALDILNINKYVIISGSPGIGKTTLAEMLVFSYLSKPNHEFIYLSDSIDDAFKMYNENKKQIFLFDDFLGRNFLQNSIALNDEIKIIRFITKIKKSKNHFIIFTTREYILNQAQQKFDVLDQELAKCIIDLSKYSKLIKAQILYNHLLHNKVPFEYIDEIVKQNLLLKIINHSNYNPRIIETFTNHKFWKKFTALEFPKELIKLFISPFLIWDHVYENQITDTSRIILNSLLIVGGEIGYNELFKQVETFQLRNSNTTINNYTYKLALRELENSMIQINKNYNGALIIKYQNPSIQDFLVSYVNKDSIAKDYVIKAVQYLKPALEIFTTEKNSTNNLKIKLNSNHLKLLEQTIIKNFIDIQFESTPIRYSTPTQTDNIINKLHLVYSSFSNSDKTIEFVNSEFLKLSYSKEISNKSVNEFSNLLCIFADEENFDIEKILENIIGSIWYYDDLSSLSLIESTFPNKFELFRENNEDDLYNIYYDITSSLVQSASDSEDISTIQNILYELKAMENNFGIDTYENRREIEKMIEKIEAEQDYYYDRNYDEFPNGYYPQRVSYINGSLNSYIENQELKESENKRPVSENDAIYDLFNSLKFNDSNKEEQ